MNKLGTIWLALALACGSAACSSSADDDTSESGGAGTSGGDGDGDATGGDGDGDGDATAGDGDGDGELPELDPTTPLSEIPDACKGFEVLGLTHSPGGDVLPNKCAPFDGTYNNPYAIRCIDANPDYESGFPGDEWCILPPPPELGTQVYIGPESYDDVPEDFLMQPGTEIDNYYYVNAPNEEDHFFYRTNWRMRAGSHHMIVNMVDEERDDGWSENGDIGLGFGGGSSGLRSFGGAQRPDQDRPDGTLDVPPENAGIGAMLYAGQQFSFNLHHFNMGDVPTLREIWVNVWYKPAEEVESELEGIAMFGNPADLRIPPGERRELHYECEVSEPTRIITLIGHRHASTSRFGVWIERADGSTETVYESFYYTDMPTYQYDTISQNPAPDLDTRTDGASSGMLELDAGDSLHFVCDVTNSLNQYLKFANEVETGEMCILFGSRTGGSLCGFLNNTPLD